MIFTTITDQSGRAYLSVEKLKGLLESIKNFDFKNNIKTEQLSFNLEASLKNDVSALIEFRKQVIQGADLTKAFNDTMGGASNTARELAQSQDFTTQSIKKFKVEQQAANDAQIAGVRASSAVSAATKILATALNVGISLAISAAVSWFIKLAQEQDNIRQKAIEASRAFDDQAKSIDDYAKKIEGLKKQLQDENLSREQERSIKEQLLGIQKDLTDSYGKQAEGISLVNGELREQLGLLSEISKQQAHDFVVENKSAYNNAVRELEKIRSYTLEPIRLKIDFANLEKERAKFDEIVSKYEGLSYSIGNLSESSEKNKPFGEVEFKIKANAEDADAILKGLYSDIEKFGKDTGEKVEQTLVSISDITKKNWTDKLAEYKTIYDQYVKAMIINDDTMRPLYKKAIDAVTAYNNALSLGDSKEIEKTKVAFEGVKQEIENTTFAVDGAKDVFDGVIDTLDKSAESAYNFTQAFEKDDKLKSFAEQLRGLTDIDLQAIRFDNTEIEQGEESFRALVDEAVAGGMSIEQAIQHVINKMVEWGYVQGEVAKEGTEGTDNLTSKINSLIDSLKALENSASLLSDIENSGLTSKNLEEISKQYSDLGDSVTAYLAGLMSEAELIDLVKSKHEENIQAYEKSVQVKLLSSEKFYKSLFNKEHELMISLVNFYQTDLNNFSTVEELKAGIKAKSEKDIENITADNIVSLSKKYDVDISNYIDTLKSKLISHGVAETSIVDSTANSIIELAKQYGIDVDNFIDAQNAKAVFAEAASARLSQAFEAIDATVAKYKPISPFSNDANKIEEFQKQYQELQYLRDADIISQEEYINSLSDLNNQYHKKDSDEWRKYFLEIKKGREQIQEQLFNDKSSDLKYRLDKNLIDQKHYYNELENLNHQFHTYGSEQWRKYELEIIKGREQLQEKFFNDQVTNLKYNLDKSLISHERYLSELETLNNIHHVRYSEEWKKYDLEISNGRKQLQEQLFNDELSDLKYQLDKKLISQKQYLNELETLNNQYHAQDSENWRKYELEIINGRKQIQEKAFNDQLSDLKYRLDRDIITQKQYITELEALNNQYHVRGSESWKKYELNLIRLLNVNPDAQGCAAWLKCGANGRSYISCSFTVLQDNNEPCLN